MSQTNRNVHEDLEEKQTTENNRRRSLITVDELASLYLSKDIESELRKIEVSVIEDRLSMHLQIRLAKPLGITIRLPDGLHRLLGWLSIKGIWLLIGFVAALLQGTLFSHQSGGVTIIVWTVITLAIFVTVQVSFETLLTAVAEKKRREEHQRIRATYGSLIQRIDEETHKGFRATKLNE